MEQIGSPSGGAKRDPESFGNAKQDVDNDAAEIVHGPRHVDGGIEVVKKSQGNGTPGRPRTVN